jgi:hypothetical protein
VAKATGVSSRYFAVGDSKQDNNLVVKSSDVVEKTFAGATDEAFSDTI